MGARGVGVESQVPGNEFWWCTKTSGRGERRKSRPIIRQRQVDLALVELSQPFSLNNCLNTARLPSGAVRDGTQCWITGWGAMSHNGQSPTALMQAQTAVVNNGQCRSQMGSRVFSSDVCVLGRYNGRPTSACNGDSGGPLICNGQLYGATAWGRNCNGITVYAGTFGNLDWIRSNMRR